MKLQYSTAKLPSYEQLSLEQLLYEEDGVFRSYYKGVRQHYCFIVLFRGHAFYYGSDHKDSRPTAFGELLDYEGWGHEVYTFERTDIDLPTIPKYVQDVNVPEEDWVDYDEDGEPRPPEIQLW